MDRGSSPLISTNFIMSKLDGTSKFIIDAIIDLQNSNATINFVKKKLLYIEDEGIKSSGYFQISNKKPFLACAIGSDITEWLPVFVHEYCHFLQWKKGLKVWTQSEYITLDQIVKIQSNKSIKLDEMVRILGDLRNLELDCEKRTVEIIRKYRLPIDIKTYIKKANAYVFFYTHIQQYRQWASGPKSAYNNQEILENISSRFYSNYEVIPKKLKGLYDKYYPPVKKNKLYK